MKKILLILALALLPLLTFAQIAHIVVPDHTFCEGGRHCKGNTMTLTDATPGGKWYIIPDSFYHPIHPKDGAIIDSNTGVMTGIDTFSAFSSTFGAHVVYSVPGIGNDSVYIALWYADSIILHHTPLCVGKADTLLSINSQWGTWWADSSALLSIDTTSYSGWTIISGLTAGTTFVTCGREYECHSTAQITVVDCPTAIPEVTQDTQPLIYPNPAINELTVNCSFERVIITNQVGQTVKTSSNKNINISDLPSGIYFVIVKSLYDTKTEKIIKE